MPSKELNPQFVEKIVSKDHGSEWATQIHKDLVAKGKRSESDLEEGGNVVEEVKEVIEEVKEKTSEE